MGFIITPFILSMSKEWEDYSDLPDFDPKSMHLWQFMTEYFGRGLSCLFEISNNSELCEHSFLFLLGYVFALFILQVTLTYLMQEKNTKNARLVFAFMVPLTALAFVIASFVEPTIQVDHIDWMDGVALVVSTAGVFMYNWFDERPQEYSVENL